MRVGDYPIVTAKTATGVDPGRVIQQIGESGAVIVRGLAPTNDSLIAISTMFADDFITYPDSRARKSLNENGTIQTVHTGEQKLLLHSELSYSPFRPDLIWFQCILPPPGSSGRTLLADGAAVLKSLSSATRSELERRWLRYSEDLEPDFWGMFFRTRDATEAWAKFQQLGFQGLQFEGNMLRVNYRQPAVSHSKFSDEAVFCNNLHHDRFSGDHLRYDDGSLPGAAIYEEIGEMLDEASRWVPWEAGDIAIIDNTRVLHGRTAVGKTNRTIHSRFGWIADRHRDNLVGAGSLVSAKRNIL